MKISQLLLSLIYFVHLSSATAQEGAMVTVNPSPFQFGFVNVQDDLALLQIHQHNIRKAITMGDNLFLSYAITDYFAATVGLTDDGVIEVVADYIHRDSNLDCSLWGIMNFTEPVNYMLCDCLEESSWIPNIQGHRLTKEQSETLLLTHAYKRIHRCNYQFAWSLLTMIVVEHGTEAGLQNFKRELYEDAVDLMKTHSNSPKAVIAHEFLAVLEKHLRKEKDAEHQYETMDLIVDSLNGMHNYHGEAWMDRFNHSIADQKKMRMPTPTITMNFLFVCMFIIMVLAGIAIACKVLQDKIPGYRELMEVIPKILPI